MELIYITFYMGDKFKDTNQKWKCHVIMGGFIDMKKKRCKCKKAKNTPGCSMKIQDDFQLFEFWFVYETSCSINCV